LQAEAEEAGALVLALEGLVAAQVVSVLAIVFLFQQEPLIPLQLALSVQGQ
jgi:hypothetical protein